MSILAEILYCSRTPRSGWRDVSDHALWVHPSTEEDAHADQPCEGRVIGSPLSLARDNGATRGNAWVLGM